MGYFSNSFRSAINGNLSTYASKIGLSSAQVIFSAVGRLRDQLLLNSGVSDSLFSALSVDSDFIDDMFVSSANVNYDIDDPSYVKISDSVSDLLIRGFSDACHKGEDVTTQEGCTISDGQGRIFNVIDQRSQNIEIDGFTVLFSSTLDPQDLSDAIIIQDSNDDIYLMNFIKTANFVRADAQRVAKSVRLPSVRLTAYERGIPIFIGDTDEAIQQRIDEYEEQVGTSEQKKSAKVENLRSAGSGSVVPIWTVVKDNVESSQLNDFLLRACEALVSGVEKTVALTNIITLAAASKFKSIITFGTGLSTAISRGGVYGAACYVVNYVKDIAGVTTSDDGTFKFADNAALTPQVYLAGVIEAITSVVSTAVTLIVSIFSKVAGVALAILGTVVSSVVKAISYDYSSVNAALNTSDCVLLPTAPYGCMQCEVPVGNITNSDLLDILNQGESFGYAIIPGGVIFYGPGSFNSDGSISTLRFEAHPSIEKTTDANLYVIKSLLASHTKASYWEETEVGVLHTYADMSIEYSSDSDRLACRTAISTYWKAAIVNNTIINGSNDHLSDADDKEMRKRVMNNLLVMSFFLSTYDTAWLNSAGYYGHCTFNLTNVSGTSYRISPLYTPVGNSGDCGVWAGIAVSSFPYSITLYDGGTELGTIVVDIALSGSAPSWANISDAMIDVTNANSTANATMAVGVINGAQYYDSISTYPTNLQHALYTPQYDKTSFWIVLAATMVVTTLVAVAVTIASFKIRKQIQMKRSINEARVARAYDTLSQDPSDENYMAYRKAVKKNNLWATFIGGSKFDLQSYWNGATNTNNGAPSGETQNPFDVVGSLLPSTTAEAQQGNIIDEQVFIQNDTGTTRIIKLISGSPEV